jgi:hypothetical protein
VFSTHQERIFGQFYVVFAAFLPFFLLKTLFQPLLTAFYNTIDIAKIKEKTHYITPKPIDF